MDELLTVANLFNALFAVICWSIRNELHHIRHELGEAKGIGNRAHKRLDEHIAQKH